MTHPGIRLTGKVRLMEMSVTHTLISSRMHVRQEEPAMLVLYGNSAFANSIATKLDVQLSRGAVSNYLMELSALKRVAHKIAPDERSFLDIIRPVPKSRIRVVVVGYGHIMIYDQNMSLIFSMLN